MSQLKTRSVKEDIKGVSSEAKMLAVVFLMAFAQLSHASFNSGYFYIPTWVIALALGVLVLLAMPLLWSLWLLGRRLISGVLNERQRKWLRVGAVFHFLYAVCYGIAWSRGDPSSLRLMDSEIMLFIITPLLLLTGLGFVSLHFGRDEAQAA